MRIVGIDPSLTSTGMCTIGKDYHGFHIDTWAVRSKPAGGLRGEAERLGQIIEKIADGYIVGGRLPTLAVIEAPAHSRGAQAGVHQRAGLWWGVVMAVHALSVPVVDVSPSARAKYATGRGNADKDAVLAAVIRRYDHLVQVGGNDEADALILAAMGARHLGHPIEDSLPAANLAAMDSVRWPA